MSKIFTLSAIDSFDSYAAAVGTATTAASAYYADGTQTMDDDVYDALVREIAVWEAARPEDVLEDSPTGKVAGGAAAGDAGDWATYAADVSRRARTQTTR